MSFECKFLVLKTVMLCVFHTTTEAVMFLCNRSIISIAAFMLHLGL